MDTPYLDEAGNNLSHLELKKTIPPAMFCSVSRCTIGVFAVGGRGRIFYCHLPDRWTDFLHTFMIFLKLFDIYRILDIKILIFLSMRPPNSSIN